MKGSPRPLPPQRLPVQHLGSMVPKVARTGGEVPARAEIYTERPGTKAEGPKAGFKPLAGYGR